MHHQFPFTNDYVFSKVMRNPEYCKEILTRILPDKRVKEVKVLNDIVEEEKETQDKERSNTQATVSQGIFSKGVRFDVLFEDDENIYNIEMQCAREGDLPLRARYYSSQLDMELLPKGKKYTHLKTSYIIFVNTKSEERTMPGDLQSLFEYINHNSVDENDTFLRKLENDIEELNHENEEWRRDVMKLEEKFAWAR